MKRLGIYWRMGIGGKNLQRLRWLSDHNLIPPTGAILELGSQNISASGEESVLQDLVREWRERAGLAPGVDSKELRRLADGGKMSRLMEMCGFSYCAFDIFADDKVTLLDINLHDLPPQFADRFDLVTNFGTTEHVFDQVRAFRLMHDAAKTGGIIYHDLPMGGYLYHGYFNYTPLLFRHMAIANDYEIIFEHYGISNAPTPVSPDMAENGFGDTHYRDAAIEFALKKTTNAPFRLPLEIGTSLGLDERVWGGRPPYRVILGAQEVRERNDRSLMARSASGDEARLRVALAQLAELREEVHVLRREFLSFKSYFSLAKPLKRLFR